MQKAGEINVKKHAIFFKKTLLRYMEFLATILKLFSQNLSATTRSLLFLDVKLFFSLSSSMCNYTHASSPEHLCRFLSEEVDGIPVSEYENTYNTLPNSQKIRAIFQVAGGVSFKAVFHYVDTRVTQKIWGLVWGGFLGIRLCILIHN